jgi:hypothetical protein
MVILVCVNAKFEVSFNDFATPIPRIVYDKVSQISECLIEELLTLWIFAFKAIGIRRGIAQIMKE